MARVDIRVDIGAYATLLRYKIRHASDFFSLPPDAATERVMFAVMRSCCRYAVMRASMRDARER